MLDITITICFPSKEVVHYLLTSLKIISINYKNFPLFKILLDMDTDITAITSQKCCIIKHILSCETRHELQHKILEHVVAH